MINHISSLYSVIVMKDTVALPINALKSICLLDVAKVFDLTYSASCCLGNPTFWASMGPTIINSSLKYASLTG